MGLLHCNEERLLWRFGIGTSAIYSGFSSLDLIYHLACSLWVEEVCSIVVFDTIVQVRKNRQNNGRY